VDRFDFALARLASALQEYKFVRGAPYESDDETFAAYKDHKQQAPVKESRNTSDLQRRVECIEAALIEYGLMSASSSNRIVGQTTDEILERLRAIESALTRTDVGLEDAPVCSSRGDSRFIDNNAGEALISQSRDPERTGISHGRLLGKKYSGEMLSRRLGVTQAEVEQKATELGNKDFFEWCADLDPVARGWTMTGKDCFEARPPGEDLR